MTISEQLAAEIRAIFADSEVEFVDDPDDTRDFNNDLAHLNALADCIIELRLPESGHVYIGAGVSVYDQLYDSLSCQARRAISDKGWTFEEMWGAA